MPLLNIAILARIPLIREGLRALLAGEHDFRVTVLSSSDDMLDELLAADAEILLLDVQVLEHEGWDLLRDLQRALPTCSTLVIGDNPNDPRVVNALALGARGFLLREASAREMANAIRAARDGIIVLHPQFAAQLAQTLRANEIARDENELGTSELIEPLSERELDVLRLLTRGRANKQIAAELFITEHTVKFHIRAILGKLGAANRTEAVTLALQKGLVSL